MVVGLGFVHLPQVAVAMLSIGVALHGCGFSGFLVNHVDIAPKYAGVLMGISNSLAAICGIAAPYVIGVLTPNVSFSRFIMQTGTCMYNSTVQLFMIGCLKHRNILV